ncbi:recombinase family protein [Kroppenstedtia pulmonis]
MESVWDDGIRLPDLSESKNKRGKTLKTLGISSGICTGSSTEKTGDDMQRPHGLDVYVYLRKSRKDIEEENRATDEGRIFDTLERHRNQLMELAKKEQHHILDIYEEVVSGEHLLDRPQIQEMLKMVDNGNCDAVMVMDLDRLGRGDMYDMGMIYRAFQYSETLIITPNEVIDPNAEGAELLFGVKSIISREELKSITKRMQRGRQVSAKEGKSITRKPPFGYLRDENLKLYPDPDHAWIVKRIFEMVAEGKGRSAIAKELTKMGIPTPDRAREWNATTLKNILNNEVYRGHIIWGTKRNVKRNGKYVAKPLPPDQWQRKDNAHEPIISQELWEKAHANYGKNYIPPVHTPRKLTNPLAGLIYCNNCNYAMQYKKDSKNVIQMECRSSKCRGVVRGISFRTLEDRVLEIMEKKIQEFKADEKEAKTKQKEPSVVISLHKKSLEAKEKELKTLYNQKENLHDFLEQGIYDIETFMVRQKKLADRIKETESEMKELQGGIIQKEREEKNRTEFIPKIRTVIDAYQTTEDIEKKNQLMKSVLDRVLYTRPKGSKYREFTIEVHFRF